MLISYYINWERVKQMLVDKVDRLWYLYVLFIQYFQFSFQKYHNHHLPALLALVRWIALGNTRTKVTGVPGRQRLLELVHT